MRITYFVQNEGGCDHYRAILPIETLCKKRNWQATKINPGKYFLYLETNPEMFENAINCDILFIPRVTSLKFFDRIVSMAKDYNPNIKIVTDYDDNVFSVSPMSPHYADYGTEPVKMKFSDGTIKTLWYNGMMFDGKPINFDENKRRLNEIKESLNKADLVLTTTERLAGVFENLGANVRVAPNCIDSKIWRQIHHEDDGKIRLIWAGGHSHYEDWFTIKDVIREIMNKYQNVELNLFGCKWDRTLDGVPMDRVKFKDWINLSAYPYELMLSGADIGLIPLRDTEFNRCKSAIKWIEYGSIGIPSVCPFIPPYKHMAKYGDNGAYIENNTPSSWLKAISYLIENESDRKRLGQAAKKTVLEHFDINEKCDIWGRHFEEVVSNGRAVESYA